MTGVQFGRTFLFFFHSSFSFSSPPLHLREVDFSHSGDNLAAVAHHTRQSHRVIVGEIEQMRKPNLSCILYLDSCAEVRVLDRWVSGGDSSGGERRGGGQGARGAWGKATCARPLAPPHLPPVRCKTRRGPSLMCTRQPFNGAQTHMDLVVSEPQTAI